MDNNQTPKVDIYKLMSSMSSLDKYFQAPTLPPLERAQKLALSIAPLISCGWDEYFLTRDGKAQKCGTRLSYVSSVLGNTEAAIFANTRFFSSAETRAKEYREYTEKVSPQNGKTL